MALPFDDPNKGKRQYQCFVCGIKFVKFEEFKSHILSSHDEGREFLVCPLPHCGAPVRDMKMHFKAKHSHSPLPKMQMRAIIWKDINARGKVKTRKPKFREGWYESTKMQKRLHYRSGYEASVYECLDLLPEVVAFGEEPFKIPYIFKGEEHTYTPDLMVNFSDGRKEIWEIKPANQTSLSQNQAKWSAAQTMCKSRGWEFMVVTEQGIAKLKKKVRMLNG